MVTAFSPADAPACSGKIRSRLRSLMIRLPLDWALIPSSNVPTTRTRAARELRDLPRGEVAEA